LGQVHGTFLFESSGDLKPSKGRERETAMRSKIGCRFRDHVRITLFQHFRKHVGVEESDVHMIIRQNGADCIE
jgi:hypothetical protein